MQIDPAVVVAAITAIAGGFGVALRLIYKDLREDRDWWRKEAQTYQQAVASIRKKKADDGA